jgi:hypothetical protein
LDNGEYSHKRRHIIGTSTKKIQDLPIDGSFVLSILKRATACCGMQKRFRQLASVVPALL